MTYGAYGAVFNRIAKIIYQMAVDDINRYAGSLACCKLASALTPRLSPCCFQQHFVVRPHEAASGRARHARPPHGDHFGARPRVQGPNHAQYVLFPMLGVPACASPI